jgi:hypothetical protein
MMRWARTCSTHKGKQKHINLKKMDHLEDLGIDGRIILKWFCYYTVNRIYLVQDKG